MSETQTVVIIADGKKLILEMECVPRYGETVNLHQSREVVTGKVVLVEWNIVSKGDKVMTEVVVYLG